MNLLINDHKNPKTISSFLMSYSSFQCELANGKCINCDLTLSKCKAQKSTHFTYLGEKRDVERARKKEIRKKCDKKIHKYMQLIKLAMKASTKSAR